MPRKAYAESIVTKGDRVKNAEGVLNRVRNDFGNQYPVTINNQTYYLSSDNLNHCLQHCTQTYTEHTGNDIREGGRHDFWPIQLGILNPEKITKVIENSNYQFRPDTGTLEGNIQTQD